MLSFKNKKVWAIRFILSVYRILKVSAWMVPIVHLDPLLASIKGRSRALMREGRAGERADEQARPLSLSNACNPYCKRIPLARDNTSRVFPLVFHLALTHLGWDTQRQFYSSVQGPPGVETPTVGAPGRGLLRVDE